jgi:hypothetical protein
MKKTKKSKPKSEIQVETLMDRLPRNRGEWLLLCVRLTEKAIKSNKMNVYKYQTDQVARLKAELVEWQNANDIEVRAL